MTKQEYKNSLIATVDEVITGDDNTTINASQLQELSDAVCEKVDTLNPTGTCHPSTPR